MSYLTKKSKNRCKFCKLSLPESTYSPKSKKLADMESPEYETGDKNHEDYKFCCVENSYCAFYNKVSRFTTALHRKPKKIVCEIERLREKETFFKGISVERS